MIELIEWARVVLIEWAKVIMAILSLIGFCFIFLGTIGIVLYHYEIWKKGKDETVHIVKGNGWCRYYTYEGWREE